MKTAREIASLAKTNRQAVYRAIRRNHIEPVGQTDTGTNLYDENNLLALLKHTKTQPKKVTSVDGQTEFYQKQIEQLTEMLKNQQQLTLQAQQLSADTKHELLSNRQQVQDLTTKNAELVAENKQLKASLDDTKKSWLARLFNL